MHWASRRRIWAAAEPFVATSDQPLSPLLAARSRGQGFRSATSDRDPCSTNPCSANAAVRKARRSPQVSQVLSPHTASALLLGALILAQITLAGGPVAAATGPAKSMADQSLAIVRKMNAIRTSAGLSAGKGTAAYTSELVQAVRSNEDPPFTPISSGIVEEFSLWGLLPSSSTTTALSGAVILDGWVNHDAWDGSVSATWNLDCTSARARGCNDHRRAILSSPPVPGAVLYVDLMMRAVPFDGSSALVVSALLVWKVR